MSKTFRLLASTLILSACAYANPSAHVSCEIGGQRVSVSGLTSSTYVQASYPGCTITVYLTGTTNKATLYSDNNVSPTPLSNPFTAGATGNGLFYTANGRYDIVLSGGGMSAPITIEDVSLLDISSPATVDGWTLTNATVSGTFSGSVSGTTVSASGGFTGNLAGNVTGNLSGNVTGNLTGNVTGNVTGSASQLETKTWEVPGTIGSTTPNTGYFTTLLTCLQNGNPIVGSSCYPTLASAYAALTSPTGGTVIVPTGYTETLAADLTLNKWNTGFSFQGTAAITMNSHQVLVPAGTNGVFFRGAVLHGGDNVDNAVVFTYSGTSQAFKIGDTGATSTYQFEFDNVTIHITGGSGAIGMELDQTVQITMINPSIYGTDTSGTIAIVFNGGGSATSYTGDAVIINPRFTHVGTGVLAQGGSSSAAMNAVTFVGGRIGSYAAGSGIGMDIQYGSQNYIFGTDFESNNTTAVRLGANAIGNVGWIRSEANTVDVLAVAGSTNNVISVNPSTGASPVFSDAGTMNQFSDAVDRSVRSLLFNNDSGSNASIGATSAGAINVQPAAGQPFNVQNGVKGIGLEAKTPCDVSGGYGVLCYDTAGDVTKLSNNGDTSSRVSRWSDFTITQKTGSGSGNYTSASTTYAVVDAASLCNTVVIPTGMKLLVRASGNLGTSTGVVAASVVLTDNATCATANSGLLAGSERQVFANSAGNTEPFATSALITGDGATHHIAMQYMTANGADALLMLNSSASLTPSMTFELMPSN